MSSTYKRFRAVLAVAAAVQATACDSLLGSGSDITIDPDRDTLLPGDAHYLRACAEDKRCLHGTWSSSDPDVASVQMVQVSRTGTTAAVLTPLAPGTVTVNVTNGDAGSATRSYTVENPPPCDRDCWMARSLMPGGRKRFGIAVLNGLVYVVGGAIVPGAAILTYDPAADRWDSLGATDADHVNFAETIIAATLDGVLYRVRAEYQTATDAYDPATGQWTPRALIPTPRRWPAGASMGGFLYVVGGTTGTGVSAAVERYDPVTDTWAARATMPTPRSRLRLAVANGILYAIGGIEGDGRTVEAYDPEADSWAVMPPLPTARRDFGAAALDGIVYVVGGKTSPGFTTLVEAFDPATNTWTRKPDVPVARSELGLLAVDGALYAIGGTTGIDPDYGDLMGNPRPAVYPRANYMYQP